MHRRYMILVGIFVSIISFIPFVSSAEVVARCGQGYLEIVDGYRVLHLKGTAYEMGYQQGALLAEECRAQFHHLFDDNLKDTKIEYLAVNVPLRQAVSQRQETSMDTKIS